LHYPAETGLRRCPRRGQRVQRGEQAKKAFRGIRFFQEQARAQFHRCLARLFVQTGREHYRSLARIGAAEQSEKLDAVHDGHFDIQDDDVHRLRL